MEAPFRGRGPAIVRLIIIGRTQDFSKGFPKGGHACDTLRSRACMVRASPVHTSP